MSDGFPLRAEIREGGAVVRLSAANRWLWDCPASYLPVVRAMYIRLRDRDARPDGKPGPFARFYAADCRVLDDVARRLARGETAGVVA